SSGAAEVATAQSSCWSRSARAAPDSARVAPARPSAMPAAVSRLTVAIRDHSSWSSHQESSEAGGHGCAARSTSRGRPRFPRPAACCATGYPRSHLLPLKRKLGGLGFVVLSHVPTKPTSVCEPPFPGMTAFQLALVTVAIAPLWLGVPFHSCVTLCPPGKPPLQLPAVGRVRAEVGDVQA